MKKTFLGIVMFLGIAFIACNHANENKAILQSTETNEIVNQKSETMSNLISIVEIPTSDFSRAVKFYQSILGVNIEEFDMDGIKMGVLQGDGETVNVVLVNGNEYKPTTDGTLLYLNAGNDLQPMLNKVGQNGGQVIVSKTEISPDMGFFALFIDTEGNKLGLHSSN